MRDRLAGRVRRLRAAADRHHRARGQRRHRQDVHHRRAGRPLRRRGPARPVASCMLVTFGRAATRELRDRVRERLVCGRARAARPAPARTGATTRCSRCSPTPTTTRSAPRRRRLAARAGRLRRGHHRHDAPFCQQMLAGLGIAGDADPGARVRRGHRRPGRRGGRRPLRAQVRAHGAGTRPFSRAEALTLGRRGGARRRRPGWSRSTPSRRHRRRAAPVRGRGARRGDAAQAAPAAARLRRPAHPARATRSPTRDAARPRSAAAVPLPGGAGRRVPGHRPGAVGHPAPRLPRARRTLVLIGDPKQAIYAFRGADVVTLPRGRATAPTGTRPWPATGAATPPLLDALDAVFGGAALGDPRIVVRPVEAAHRGRRSRGAPVDTPLRLRVVPRAGLPRARSDLAVVGPARDAGGRRRAPPTSSRCWPARPTIGGAARCSPATSRCWCAPTTRARWCATRSPRPGCRRCWPAPAASSPRRRRADWLTLLEALEQPHRAGPAAGGRADPPSSGSTVTDLERPRTARTLTDELGATVRGWADVLPERGVAALLEAVTAGTELPRRLLGPHRR